MKEYKVSGARSYRGHEPGSTFTEDLSEAEEERACARGSISVVGEDGNGQQAAPEEEPEPEAQEAQEPVEDGEGDLADTTGGDEPWAS